MKCVCGFLIGIFCRGRVHCIYGPIINVGKTSGFVAVIDVLNIAAHFVFKSFIAETQYFDIIPAVIKRLCTVRQLLAVSHLQFHHQFTEICVGVFRINIQYFFAINVGVLPLSVLKKKKNSFQKRSRCGIASVYHHRFLYDGGRSICGNDFLDAADKILHKAELRHILRLQMRKFLRQVVGIHIPVGGDQYLFAAGMLHKCEIAAPLVLYPHSVEMLRLRTEHDHDLC